MLDTGYSILTYDRLGTGLSVKLDAYTVVQAPLELEILHQITEMVRSGELLDYARKCGAAIPSINFEKLVHVGHSFGSILTAAFLTRYGNLLDVAVLTGFILNKDFADIGPTSFGFELVLENDPVLFRSRLSGYVVPVTASAVQTIYFSTRRNALTSISGFNRLY